MLHKIFWWFANHTYNWWTDALWLKMIYRQKMHRRLNIKEPKRFTEKLQWLKLHDRNPLYSTLVDKYEVKKFVAKIMGEEHIIQTIGVWNHFDEIDFDKLPNKFVIKCTHDSGNVIICKDKDTFNKEDAKNKLESSLKHNFYWWTREWPYKNVKGRIIAEEYMFNKGHENDALTDYKFYCFGGEPKIVMVSSGRFQGNLCFDYYDMEWHKLPLVWDKPNSNIDHPKPKTFDEMIGICKKLSKNIPHVRIDLYDIFGIIYFGEFTFYDSGGYCVFSPDDWDYKLGNLITEC